MNSQKGNDSKGNRNILVVVIIVIILLLLLLLLIRSCKCGSEQTTDSQAVDKDSAQTEESITKTGILVVKAVKDFPFIVYDSESGKEVAKGNCGIGELKIKPGKYMVKVKPNKNLIPLGIAVILENKTNTLEFKGFGTLFVSGAKDFVKYNVFDKNGKKVTGGDTNITTLLLPAGDYKIETTVLEKKSVDSVSIGKKQAVSLKLKSFGALKVGARKDFLKFAVKDKSNKKVASGDSNISVLVLPVGAYLVECDGKSKKLEIEGGDWKQLNFGEK